jgi:hypothetical protein
VLTHLIQLVAAEQMDVLVIQAQKETNMAFPACRLAA